jgi:hypothetical protein
MTKEEKLAKFGPGPWVEEPDRIEWRIDGVPCLMVRNESGGHWCGYAAVAPGHPWHGTEYNDVDLLEGVHGGLTYSEKCALAEDFDPSADAAERRAEP